MDIKEILKLKTTKILIVTIISVIIGFAISTKIMEAEKYRPLIISELSKATGKKVTIDGDIALNSTPILNLAEIIISDITIHDSKDNKNIDFIKAKKLVLDLSLIDFILGKVNFKAIELHDAKIDFINTNNSKESSEQNWSFIYSNFQGQKSVNIKQIAIKNSTISYQTNSDIYSFDKSNLNLILNKDVTISGNINFKENNLNVNSTITKLTSNNPDIALSLSNQGIDAKIKGSILKQDNNLQVKSSLQAKFTQTDLIGNLLSGISPFLTSMTSNNLKDPVSISSEINLSSKELELSNLKISSNGTNGVGTIKTSLQENQNNYIDLNFENIDLTNFISFDENNLAAFSDRILGNKDNSLADENQHNSFLDFNFIDQNNVSINFKANNIVTPNTSLKNVDFNFNSQAGIVNKGNISFNLENNKNSSEIKLNNLHFQKVDDIYVLLGDFSNKGSDINETIKLLNLQDIININGKNNYNIDSKIILSPKEISIFNIIGNIGEKGGFSGSIASTYDDMSHYNIDLKITDLSLNNLSTPLIKERISALVNKSNDEDYLSYFRWFRTLLSSYRIKLEFKNTEIENEKFDSLKTTCKLLPGSMSLKLDLNSDVADGIYQIDLTANQVKPTLETQVNSLHIDFDRLRPIIQSITQSDVPTANLDNNSFWSDERINIFRLNKYNAKFDFSVIDLKFNDKQLQNFRSIGNTSNNVLYLDNLYFKIYGGQVQAKGNISFFEQLFYQLSFNISNLRSKDILKDTGFAVDGIEGPASLTGSIITRGNSPKELISNLTLSSNFAAPKITITGLDNDVIVDVALRRKDADKTQVIKIIDKLLNNGTTILNNVNGTIKSKNGLLESNDINFKTRFSNAVFAMSLDLNNLTFSSNTQFIFSPYAYKNSVSYNLTKSGDLRKGLDKEIDKTSLLKYVKWQYSIVTDEDLAIEKKKIEEQKKILAEDPDNKDYLYYKLQEKINQTESNDDSNNKPAGNDVNNNNKQSEATDSPPKASN